MITKFMRYKFIWRNFSMAVIVLTVFLDNFQKILFL